MSIAINNYNYERYVGAAIQSALDQTYSPIEVIVVDDGSSDGSRLIIDQFEANVQRVYQNNAGQGAAINAGFAASSGAVVIFLDSDDILDKRCVEEIMRSWAAKTVQVSYGHELIDSAGTLIRKTNDSPTPPSGDLRGKISTDGGVFHVPTSGNAFSAAFLKQVLPLPAERWRIDADVYLCYLAAAAGYIKHLPAALCFYRKHGSNHSSPASSAGRVRYERLYRTRIQTRVFAFEAVVQYCATVGLLPPSFAFHRRPYFLRDCLMVKRLAPNTLLPLAWDKGRAIEHSISLLRLVWMLIMSSITEDSKSVTHRMMSIAWACTFVLMPVSIAERLYLKTIPN